VAGSARRSSGRSRASPERNPGNGRGKTGKTKGNCGTMRFGTLPVTRSGRLSIRGKTELCKYARRYDLRGHAVTAGRRQPPTERPLDEKTVSRNLPQTSQRPVFNAENRQHRLIRNQQVNGSTPFVGSIVCAPLRTNSVRAMRDLVRGALPDPRRSSSLQHSRDEPGTRIPSRRRANLHR